MMDNLFTKLRLNMNNMIKLLLLLLIIIALIFILKETTVLKILSMVFEATNPIIIGLCIAFLLENNIKKLAEKYNRIIACIIVYMMFSLFIVALFTLIILPLSSEIRTILISIPDIITNISNFISQSIEVSGLTNNVEKIINIGTNFAIEKITAIFNSISSLFSSFIAATFFSIDKDSIIDFVSNHFNFSKKIINFVHACSSIFNYYLFGIFLDLIFLFIVSYIVLFTFQIQNIIFYASFISFMNLLPIIGPIICFGFLIILFYLSNVENFLICLIILWIVQQVESNIIQPLIFKKTLKIRPILTFISLLIMGKFFGIVGIILSPIVASILQIGYKTFILSSDINAPKWEDI